MLVSLSFIFKRGANASNVFWCKYRKFQCLCLFTCGNNKSTLCLPPSIWHHRCWCSLKALCGTNHSSRSVELLIPHHVWPFRSSINRSMAKLNKDTQNITHLSATLDIFSRCRSNCNCQKVIWNQSRDKHQSLETAGLQACFPTSHFKLSSKVQPL